MKRIHQNIFVLMTGSSVAQVLNFFIYLLLAKLYGPSQFGAFGLFTAIFFVMAEIVNAKFDQSIMLPEKQVEAIALTRISMLIGTVIALTLTLLIFLWQCLTNALFIGLSFNELLLVPLALLFFAIWQSLQVFCNRIEAYSFLSLARVVQVLVTGAVSYFLYDSNLGVNGLILGFVVGWLAAIMILLFPSLPQLSSVKNETINSKNLIKEYSAFPKYGSLSALVNTFSRYLPYFFLMPGFGSVLTGQYTLAHKILNAPVGIIGGAIGQVFFREASKKDDVGIFRLAKEMVIRNFLLAVVPSLIILFFGETLFEMLFGYEWKMAGRVAQVLILWILMTFIAGPVSTIIDLKQHLRWELIYNICFLLFRALALLIGVYYQQFFWAIAGYALVGVIFNTVFLWKLRELLKVDK